ncbi:MAG TPA: hypothetical protein VGB37_05220 [Candidatus Lokiarchaeia archaeon]
MELIGEKDLEIFALSKDQLKIVNEFSEKINKKIVKMYIENIYIGKYVVDGDLADQFRKLGLSCQNAFLYISKKSGWKNVEFKIKMEVDEKNVEEKNYLVFNR